MIRLCMIAFLSTALVVMIVGSFDEASALECEHITDPDQRHYCRAIAIPRPSECEFIKNHDLRHECRARTK